MKKTLLQALYLDRGFLVFTCVLCAVAFVLGRLTAPITLPHLVSLQHERPTVHILQPLRAPAKTGQSTEAGWRFSRYIYWHNVKATGYDCLLGLLLLPLHVILVGCQFYISGVVFYADGIQGYIHRISPHGLIEIPATMFVHAAAIQAGWRLLAAPWKQKVEQLKEGLWKLAIIWLFAALLLLPAALLEAFARPWLWTLF